MKTVTVMQENAEDVLEGAKQINIQREEEEAAAQVKANPETEA